MCGQADLNDRHYYSVEELVKAFEYKGMSGEDIRLALKKLQIEPDGEDDITAEEYAKASTAIMFNEVPD